MKDFFKTSSFKVLAIAVVVLLGLLIYTATAGGSLLASLLGFVTSPMQSVSTQATGAVTEFVDLDALSRDELKEPWSNSLTQENAHPAGPAGGLREHPAGKRAAEGPAGHHGGRPGEHPAGRHGHRPGPQRRLFYGFSIDQGTLAGISVGDPVITQQGLVGVVTQAYATTSKVTTLLSEDVNVSAVVPSRGESGVISSDITSASAGLLRLSYLSNDTQVQEGDIVTTSGVGGTYPADVIIGQVQSVQKSENDISNYAVIKPYEDLTSVQDVFVVIDFPGAGDGEEIPVGQDTSGEEDAE